MNARDPDLVWVRALQGGDARALDALMERYQRGLFAFIYRYVSHQEDARELTQETFVRAYFHIGKFKPNALFSTWLFRIALNLCRDHVRSKAYRQGSRTESLDARLDEFHGSPRKISAPQTTPEEELVAREELAAVEREIDRLPLELKEAFILHVLEQRPQDEVAALLGVTRKAVETRVYRARKTIGKALGKK